MSTKSNTTVKFKKENNENVKPRTCYTFTNLCIECVYLFLKNTTHSDNNSTYSSPSFQRMKITMLFGKKKNIEYVLNLSFVNFNYSLFKISMTPIIDNDSDNWSKKSHTTKI